MKILVIDPDKAMREVLIKTIGAITPFSPLEGETVDTESLSLIANEKPEIIFVDYDCFADSPTEIITQIKKNSPPSKIILISGVGADEKIVQTALQTSGAESSIIAKPFNADEIRHAITPSAQNENAAKNSQLATPQPSKSFAEDTAKHGASRRRKYIYYAISGGVIFIIAAAFLFFYHGNLSIPRPQPSASFTTNVKNPSYISATTNGEIIITDWQEETVYFYKAPSSPLEKSLIPLYSVKVKEVQPSAACVMSGQSNEFVVTDALQGMFFVIKSELPKGSAPSFVTNNGIITGSYKSPGSSPSGILVLADKKEAWSYDSMSQKLYCHYLKDFSVKKIYELPVANPAGITFMNNRFYLGESNTGRIIELNPSDMSISSMIKPRVYSSSSNEAGGEHLVSVASDGRNLWSISESGMVYRHHPSEFDTTIK